MSKILFKLMVQLMVKLMVQGLTCHAHIMTLLWLILTTELKIRLSNPQFGNASEMTFFFFSVWKHNINTLPTFLDYLNNIDSTGKTKFTMQIADENGLEFLDLKLKMNENSKITVGVFSKPTYSFTYVMPSTCYPSNNINNVPRGIALRFKRICDSDEKFTASSRSIEIT